MALSDLNQYDKITTMKKIIIVPTSHIAEQSIKKIKEVIEKEKPDCVAVELDPPRYEALKSGEKVSSADMLKNMGPFTFLVFYLLRYLQNKIGGMVGIVPGSDMLTGVEEARKNDIDVAFIDTDIRMTAYKFRTEIPFKEKLGMIKYIFQAGFFIYFGKYLGKFFRSKDENLSVDLRNVPQKDIIKKAMDIFKDKFPVLYRILLEDRNRDMAGNIVRLIQRYEKVVVIIGAGHEEGLKEELSKRMNLNENKERKDTSS